MICRGISHDRSAHLLGGYVDNALFDFSMTAYSSFDLACRSNLFGQAQVVHIKFNERLVRVIAAHCTWCVWSHSLHFIYWQML